jgi:glycosyltransferase involved in cell wall biosynthesis
LAIRHVKKAAAKGARIYHYRAGFGGASVKVAQRLGMITLCDHASVHPILFEYLVDNKGKMPRSINERHVGHFWRYVLQDIKQADAVLVNSNFAAETFRNLGDNSSLPHVIYLGVDDYFLANVPNRENAPDVFNLLFAGTFGKGKGAETLIEALRGLDSFPWRLEIAGSLSAEMLNCSRRLFADPRVKYLGQLSRQELARAMSRADVFVFPSLSEGSARVVFEALACGCYIITTPNSGSIVEDGVHGCIVPPGDCLSLADAIGHAYRHRDVVSRIGRSNALLVKAKYNQNEYGDQLACLYRRLVIAQSA